MTKSTEPAIHQAAVPSARAPAFGGTASTTRAARRYATATSGDKKSRQKSVQSFPLCPSLQLQVGCAGVQGHRLG